jgi:hypothetical protein
VDVRRSARANHVVYLPLRRTSPVVSMRGAERLPALANDRLPWPWIDAEKALPWIERRTGLILTESQKTALRLVA